ncbi:MAG: hypothetical protein KatS3mg110_4305 [Pirellulaceae bacterium]|nr:MAG: hypothetical protein KatS3mg110_4305 [Pirellulaceae bacterium]
MELIGLILIVVFGIWLYSLGYRSGKRTGSRKAYGVGFDRGRRSVQPARSSGPTGCLLTVLGLLAMFWLAGWLLAR